MSNIQDILNKIKWTKDIQKIEIWYIHRGTPNNTKKISGKNICKIYKSSLETKTSTIPYHRIFKILYEDEILFKRKQKRNF